MAEAALLSACVAKACLDSEPIDSDNPVRLPGQSALAKNRRYQLSANMNPMYYLKL
jgi:hypothetical protein